MAQNKPQRAGSRLNRSRAGAMLTALGLLLALAFSLSGAPVARAVYTSNPGAAVTIPAGAFGAATPYPSTVTVNGVSGSIVSVVVRLNGLSHTFPDDLDIVLVGPAGQAVMLMSDAGGDADLVDVDLAFSGASATDLPCAAQISSGTYRPTNCDGVNDTLPANASLPAGPYGSALSSFNLTNPNGIWRLYIAEDLGGSSGALDSWELDIVTADLQVSFGAVPDTVNAGDSFDYDIVVTNAGTDPVANVTLSGTIPASTSITSINPTATPTDWTCPTPASGATSFSCTATSFDVGSATIRVTLAVHPSTARDTFLQLTTNITSATQEANTTNNTASDTVRVTTSANLELVSLTAPTTLNAGQNLQSVATVRNNGPSYAINTSVTLPLDADTTFVSLSAPGGWTCATPAVGSTGTATCNRASFVLTTVQFTLTVKVNPGVADGETVTSSATVASQTDDPAANNSDTATTDITTSADLSISVTDAPDPVSAGAQLTYTIVATNSGPSNANQVEITTTIPANATFVSLTAASGWTCSAPTVGEGGAVSCTRPTFGLSSATFTLRVQVKQGTPTGTSIPLAVAIASTGGSATPDPDGADNSANAATAVTIIADLSVTMSVNTNEIRPGESLVYTIRANNSGPEFANDVALTLSVPANTAFVSLTKPVGWTCATPAVGAAGAISCTNPAFDVTANTFVLTVTALSPADDVILTNTASISSPATDGNPGNNSATAVVRLAVKLRNYLPLILG